MSNRTRRDFLKDALTRTVEASLLTSTASLLAPVLAQAQVTGVPWHGVNNAFVWGAGASGVLGRNDTTGRSTPVVLPGRWSYVAASELDPATYTTPKVNCAGIKPDGTLWLWGDNTYGQIGDSTTVAKSLPVQVPGSWSKVFCSDERTHAIRTDGTLWSWGVGTAGDLGVGSTTNFSSPVQVAGSWTQVAAGGSTTAGIRTDGTFWVWGYNTDGELGNSATVNKSSPIQVAGSWLQIAGGGDSHMGGLRNDNTIWLWGYNGYGQLGQGNTTSKSSPVQVPGTWSAITASTMSTFALRPDATLWGWGSNNKGNLAQAGGGQFTSPVQIPGSWAQIAAGTVNQAYANNKDYGFAVGIRTDGTMWSWGYNASGQLGLGDLVDRSSPVQIPGSWTQVSAGSNWAIAIRKSAT